MSRNELRIPSNVVTPFLASNTSLNDYFRQQSMENEINQRMLHQQLSVNDFSMYNQAMNLSYNNISSNVFSQSNNMTNQSKSFTHNNSSNTFSKSASSSAVTQHVVKSASVMLKKKRKSCDQCSKAKKKCDSQLTCLNCFRLGVACVYSHKLRPG